VIYISLPALTLFYLPALRLSWEMLYPLSVGALVLCASWMLFGIWAKISHIPVGTLGCLVLVCGLGNTSFVGFPIVKALYGEEGLRWAIFVDQGSFLALSLLGVPLAMRYGGRQVRAQDVIQRLFRFPPFIAFLIGLGLLITQSTLPALLNDTLGQIGSTLVPVALVSIGLRIPRTFPSAKRREVIAGLSYKMLLAPALVYSVLLLTISPEDLVFKVSVAETAMPPMVTSSIIASQYGLNPALGSFLVGVGLLLSPISLSAWWWFMEI